MNSTLSIIKGIHPGLYLERELKKRQMAKGRFALGLGEYPQTLGAITKGKRSMNTALAMKIEIALNLEEGFLMMLQVFHDIEREKKSHHTAKPDLRKFRRALFWDTDPEKIDWHKQKRAVIKRIFQRGNEREKKEITQFYGRDIIDSALNRA
ncbi:MAG: plasmid maintenance system antidote protein [Cyclobacteriaceae bacterium]|nr:plasmid maintenance system antidote protein [Cyclobacteriaceae bacterium]